MTKTSAGSAGDRGNTDFGFDRVRRENHPGLVRGVFDSIADRYDIMNDLMSGGLHRLWKNALIDWVNPRADMRLIDLAGGTGDVAFRFLDKLSSNNLAIRSEAIICDSNMSMLKMARTRAIDNGILKGLSLICAPAEGLPFGDRIGDICTISFGLRNVTNRQAALAEIYRCLDIGGHFLCLEFSPSILPVLAPLYDAYSYQILPWLGEQITGDHDAYKYLVESIRRFPIPDTLSTEICNAGFSNVTYRAMTAGIVAIHSGWRI